MNKNVIVDFDGTLCDTSRRTHLAQDGFWDEFHQLCIDDKPIESTVDLLICLDNCGITLIGLTGRNERYRKLTNDWLQKYNLAQLFSSIFMRGDLDFSPDVEMKLSRIEVVFGSKQEAIDSILFCLDDRDKVVEGMRDWGLTVHQVRSGDY